jgi:DNA-binding transcriptional ArsR family regulator
MFVVDKKKEGIFSLPAQEISPKDARHLGSELAIKIVKLLAAQPMYPVEIAKHLKVHEQKVYYHIRNLEKAGIIKVVREEGRQGAVARYYSTEKPALILRFREMEATQKIFQMKSDARFLNPIIQDSTLNALIVVGSPDPHGPEKARSRDGYYGMDLALFLGTFLSYVPQLNVKLDTEVRESDLKNNNLILIGGPVVNRITGLANAKLPVRFDRDEHWSIKSTLSGNSYPTDESGLIVKAKSPFNPEKSVLVVAGKRHSGTRAAIVAFLKHFGDISRGNLHNRNVHAKVVEGIDLDSDGIIDDAEVRE